MRTSHRQLFLLSPAWLFFFPLSCTNPHWWSSSSFFFPISLAQTRTGGLLLPSLIIIIIIIIILMFSVLQFWWSSSFKLSKTHLNLIPTHKTQTKSNSQRKIKEINNKGEANLHLDQNLGWKLIGCAAYLILQIVARDVKSRWWKEAGTLDCCGAIEREREREREMGGSLKEWERDESELWRSFSLFNPPQKKKSMSDKYLLYLKNTYTYQTRNCVFLLMKICY